MLGCGITGMTVARALARRGERVVLLDDYPAAGGNHLSHVFDGLEFDSGAIYFHHTDKQFRHFPELLEGFVPLKVGHCKINTHGRLVPFPFSMRGDLPGWRRVLMPLSFAEAMLRRLTVGAGRNVDTFVRSRIGSPLYRASGLDGYLTRFFGCPPEEIDVAFAASRLGWITRSSSLRHQLRRRLGRDPRRGDALRAGVRRPGGFAAYYAPAVAALERDGVAVRLGAGLGAIRTRPDGVKAIVARGGTLAARRVISTVPIPLAARLADVAVPHLEHADLHSLFVEAERPLNTPSLVVYNFGAHGAWKRLTLHSGMYNAASGRTAFTVEVPVPERAPLSDAAAFADFAAHVGATGLGGGRLRLLGAAQLKFAYPLFRTGYAPQRDAALAALAAAGIESIGRQGGYDYLPTSSVATVLAERYAARR